MKLTTPTKGELREENRRLWLALAECGWPRKCLTCGHDPGEHDVWNRCTLVPCLCRRYNTGTEFCELPR